MGEKPRIVQMDARGRASFGWVEGLRENYLARVEDDGTIILEPAVVMTKSVAVDMGIEVSES